jgi:hypothetical protein
VVDNEALGVFDARHMSSREVDAAIHAINDRGVVADVDQYRGHMLDYEDLLQAR